MITILSTLMLRGRRTPHKPDVISPSHSYQEFLVRALENGKDPLKVWDWHSFDFQTHLRHVWICKSVCVNTHTVQFNYSLQSFWNYFMYFDLFWATFQPLACPLTIFYCYSNPFLYKKCVLRENSWKLFALNFWRHLYIDQINNKFLIKDFLIERLKWSFLILIRKNGQSLNYQRVKQSPLRLSGLKLKCKSVWSAINDPVIC